MENPFFKEGDQLAYVVWYDNMEPYDDNYTKIDAIFSSWDEAERYIEMEYGDRPNFKRERVRTYAVAPDLFEVSPTISTLDWTFENDWDKPRLTIEIWNLSTGKQVHFDNKHIFLVEENSQEKPIV